MTKISDTDILRAIESLRSEWPSILGSEATALEEWLAKVPSDDAEAVRQTTNRILDVVRAHPQAAARLSSELGIKGDLVQVLRSYEPPPSKEEEIPPGPLAVCPVDPDHYRVKLRVKGQRCPDHDVLLVEADSLPLRE